MSMIDSLLFELDHSREWEYQEVQQYLLSRDWAGLKWCPVLKVWEQLQDKQSEEMQNTIDENPQLFLRNNLAPEFDDFIQFFSSLFVFFSSCSFFFSILLQKSRGKERLEDYSTFIA